MECELRQGWGWLGRSTGGSSAGRCCCVISIAWHVVNIVTQLEGSLLPRIVIPLPHTTRFQGRCSQPLHLLQSDVVRHTHQGSRSFVHCNMTLIEWCLWPLLPLNICGHHNMCRCCTPSLHASATAQGVPGTCELPQANDLQGPQDTCWIA